MHPQQTETPTTSASTAHPPTRPVGAGVLITVLAALSAMAPLAIDMYVPAFPRMAASLGASASAIQLSMTACLVGLVVGQLVIGPLSDSRGRRAPLLVGTLAFIVFSLASAAAPNAAILTGTRFLQGIAGAAGMVVARAVLTDRFHGPALAQKYAILSMVIGVAPVVAPVVGGAIIGVAPWRMIFVALAAIGLVQLMAVARWVPESLPVEQRARGGLTTTLRAMGQLLHHRAFVGYVLTLSAASAAMFAYISGSSFVFQDHYGVSPGFYSAIFAVNASAMVVASFAFGRLARRTPVTRLLGIGVAIALAGSLAQVLIDLTSGGTLTSTWICLAVTQFGIAWITAGTMTMGQTLARGASGAGSALLGGGQFTLGAIVSPLVGMFGAGSPLPMAVIMLIGYGLAALALLAVARPRLRDASI